MAMWWKKVKGPVIFLGIVAVLLALFFVPAIGRGLYEASLGDASAFPDKNAIEVMFIVIKDFDQLDTYDTYDNLEQANEYVRICVTDFHKYIFTIDEELNYESIAEKSLFLTLANLLGLKGRWYLITLPILLGAIWVMFYTPWVLKERKEAKKAAINA